MPVGVGLSSFIDFFEVDPARVLVGDVIADAECRGWEPALVGGNEGVNVNKRFRDSFIQKFSVAELVRGHVPLLSFANACLDDYLGKFPEACKLLPFDFEDLYNILKYEKGQAYHATHADYFPAGYFARRHLTGVCFLSDVDSGG